MTYVSLINMRICLKQSVNSAWRAWVIADDRDGIISYWNGQRYPRLSSKDLLC